MQRKPSLNESSKGVSFSFSASTHQQIWWVSSLIRARTTRLLNPSLRWHFCKINPTDTERWIHRRLVRRRGKPVPRGRVATSSTVVRASHRPDRWRADPMCAGFSFGHALEGISGFINSQLDAFRTWAMLCVDEASTAVLRRAPLRYVWITVSCFVVVCRIA